VTPRPASQQRRLPDEQPLAGRWRMRETGSRRGRAAGTVIGTAVARGLGGRRVRHDI